MRIQAQITLTTVYDGAGALQLELAKDENSVSAKVYRGGAALSEAEVDALGTVVWLRDGRCVAEGQAPGLSADEPYEALLERRETLRGNPITFTETESRSVRSLTAAINPVQEGSGDPSPENVRPISGWTGAEIVVSQTQDAADGTTYPISWQDEAGTVYGGTLDATTGLLTVDRELRSLTGKDVTAVNNATGYAMISLGAYGYIKPSASCISNLLVCSTKTAGNVPPGEFSVINSQGYNRAHVVLKLDFTSATKTEQLAKYKEQLDEWSEAGTPLQVLYFLSAPRVYQLTPQEVITLQGENNVWADTGEVSITLGEALARGTWRPTQRLHIRYSDDGQTFTAGGGQVVGAWIGTLVDFKEEASGSFDDYTWKRFADDKELSERLGAVESSVGELSHEMRMDYVAKSDFGTYAQQVTAQIEANARAVTESYSYAELISAAAARGVSESLEQYMTLIDGQIRRGYLTDPDTGETVIGIAISQKLQFTGQVQTVDGETCYELDPAQTFGLYTSTGWQFWVGGQKIGWFDSADGMLHVVKLAAEQELKLGDGWLLTSAGGFGIRYIGG